MKEKLPWVLLGLVVFTSVFSIAADEAPVSVAPAQIESAMQAVRSNNSWEYESPLILSSLDTIRKSRHMDAIPFLVAHIDFAPLGDNADITMGNISKVYPVPACLIDLGEESARGIIDYLRCSEQPPSDKAMLQYKRVLVAVLGKSKAKQLLNENINKAVREEERLRKLVNELAD